jgi:hypothetical protein
MALAHDGDLEQEKCRVRAVVELKITFYKYDVIVGSKTRVQIADTGLNTYGQVARAAR